MTEEQKQVVCERKERGTNNGNFKRIVLMTLTLAR
jgi:hypothetical protein